jgi:N-acetylmuramoyl-L-alanine amidase
MRAGNIERVKRRLLQEAVAENLDTIRGMPPRAVRPGHRLLQIWLRRAPLLLIPLTLVASTYVAKTPAIGSPSPGAARHPLPLAGEGSRGAAAASVLSSIESEQPLERVTASAFPLAVKRVVLDAGHGGNDPGATAAQLLEKSITLDIGRRLQVMLEKRGFQVVTTRPDDRTVPLRERARLANESKSDIFVSIHVNALVKHTASHGVETYYLGATSDPSLTKLAAAENHGSGYSLGDLRKLLDGVYADARRDESRELATVVQKKLHGGLHRTFPELQNWGVKRAPFIVLVATDMPAVLAEVGCISNEREAAMLDRPEYRQKIAEALFDGIHAYASANEAPQQKGT